MRLLVLLGCALLSLNFIGSDPADLIFVAVGGLILLTSPGTLLFHDIHPIARLTMALVVAFYVLSCLAGWRSPSFILYSVSGMLFALSLYWATEHDDRAPVGLALLGGFVLLNALILVLSSVGLWPLSIVFDLFLHGRFRGPSGDPNMTGLTAAFAVYFFLDRAIRPNASTSGTLLSYTGLIGAMLILLTSGSRSAWAATAAGLAVYLLVARRAISVRMVGAGFALVAGVMVISMGAFSASNNVEDVSERFRTILVQSDSAEQERFGFVYTRAALAVAADFPLGIGPGMTPLYTGVSSVDGHPIGAHNSYVEVLVENGWATAVLLFGLLCVAWPRVYRLAQADLFYNDVSCRTILAGLTATAIFGMGHDLLAWRIGWIFPVLAILAAFSNRYPAGVLGAPVRA
jgi:hypothetical protein